MFWQSGDKVYLIHTRQWGIFGRYLDNETAMILPDDDDEEIPVHLDDLDYHAPPPEVAGPTPTPVAPVHPGSTDIRGVVETRESGIFLAITADPDHMEVRKFYILLINDGRSPLSFESHFAGEDLDVLRKKGDLQQGEWIELVALAMDQLHHQPEITVRSFWKLEDQMLERPLFSLRPRPKTVFSKMTPNSYFNFPAVLYALPDETGVKEALQVHTRRRSLVPSDRALISSTPAPHLRASFDIVQDLHAERLFADPGKISSTDIFARQMLVFEQFLKQAIQVGVPHVFIIHGLGKGKLKKAIAERCKHIPEVKLVRNDYHPKYGFGASEIVFV
ncbi:MAG: Smr/MutS family protein [Saprospiraceae bacterium]|nr:Smr/MutS family protein [Saprospiraceae bacterium]